MAINDLQAFRSDIRISGHRLDITDGVKHKLIRTLPDLYYAGISVLSNREDYFALSYAHLEKPVLKTSPSRARRQRFVPVAHAEEEPWRAVFLRSLAYMRNNILLISIQIHDLLFTLC